MEMTHEAQPVKPEGEALMRRFGIKKPYSRFGGEPWTKDWRG